MRDSTREALNEFRTGPLGIALFYGYLIAILLTTVLLVVVLVKLNQRSHEAHNLAVQSHALAAQNARAIAIGKRALCNQKRQKIRTIEDTEKYLNSPRFRGKSLIFGIDRPVLERSLRLNQRDLRALADVKCKS